MFYANDVDGEKTSIDEAQIDKIYTCPACNCELIQKRGQINAHHFAHKSGKECDAWYSGEMSEWHKRMQNYFPKQMREVAVWNEEKTEYHIADVVFVKDGKHCVMEFQHSYISLTQFQNRTNFYMQCGYHVYWVFDFCECKTPKRIYIANNGSLDINDYIGRPIHLAWPGNDRPRFLDGIDYGEVTNYLIILFYISTGIGIEYYGYYDENKWRYVDPFNRVNLFVALDLSKLDNLREFDARSYSEEGFTNTYAN